MLLAGGFKKSFRVWWETTETTGEMLRCLWLSAEWKTSSGKHHIAWKCRFGFICVLTGIWEATVEHSYVLSPDDDDQGHQLAVSFVAHFCPARLLVSNNTITQLKIHFRHLQIIWLCQALHSHHPETRSSVPSLFRMPNGVGREGYEALPPWEGLHKPMVCKP